MDLEDNGACYFALHSVLSFLGVPTLCNFATRRGIPYIASEVALGPISAFTSISLLQALGVQDLYAVIQAELQALEQGTFSLFHTPVPSAPIWLIIVPLSMN